MTDPKYADRNGWVYCTTYYAGRVERMVVFGQPKMDYRCVCGLDGCGRISFARNLSGVKDQHREHVAAEHPRKGAGL